jgi:hypothetical protein
MRTKILFFVAATLLFSAYTNHAEAQFWKKLFHKEEKKPVKKKVAPKPKPEVKEKPVSKQSRKKRDIDYPATVKKDRYRIDVLVPLYLNELIKDDKPTFKGRIPEKAIGGLDFYEGVKLAADTLNSFGYNIDVYIHDVMDAAATPDALISKKVLDSSDLVIGAVNYKEIRMLADFALKHKINFVSAMSPSDGDVKENPYFILLQPTFTNHCLRIKEALDNKFPKQKPIIFYRTGVKMDETAFGNFADLEASHKVLVNTMPLQKDVAKLLDSTKTNVILMPILDVSYSEKLLYQLHQWFPGYKLEVYGMPSWKGMNSLKKADAYSNIGVSYTDPFYFDVSTSSGQAVAHAYKKASGSAKPSELVFRGYETLFWYSYLLSQYGTIFNEKFKDNGTAPFTRFEIKPQWDNDDKLLYHENQHIYLVRYQSASFMVEQ